MSGSLKHGSLNSKQNCEGLRTLLRKHTWKKNISIVPYAASWPKASQSSPSEDVKGNEMSWCFFPVFGPMCTALKYSLQTSEEFNLSNEYKSQRVKCHPALCSQHLGHYFNDYVVEFIYRIFNNGMNFVCRKILYFKISSTVL